MIYRAISKLITSLIYHPSSCQDTPFADDYDTVLDLIRETQVESTKVYKNFVVVALKKNLGFTQNVFKKRAESCSAIG